MIIEQPAKFIRWLYPHALWRMDKADHSVYLTFDDGPIPESTPFILKTLRDFDVKATFFCVGDNVRRYPELFREIVREGHRVGNHTFNHIGGLRHGYREYIDNVEKCQEVMENAIHAPISTLHSRLYSLHAPLLFRPPHGWMLHDEYISISKKYRVVMWDLVTRDYSHKLSAFDVVRNVHDYTRNGSIITFHDSLKSIDKLYFALPASIRWLKSEGYNFKLIK